MNRTRMRYGIGILLLTPFVASAMEPGGKDLPLGHPDFRPSPQRPVGERGDWTGLFTGAKGVALDWDHRTGKNIVWTCALPACSNSSPIVVGDKVFVGSEPDELFCVDAAKGTVLWKQSIFIDRYIPEPDRAGVRQALREAMEEAQAVDIPGAVAAQWLAALKPAEDAAVAATARRIDENLARIRARGLTPGKLQPTDDAGILSREGEALLEKHKLLVKKKGREQSFFHGNWLYQAGFTMPTPLSDGKHVWYQTGLGALACLDLEGKLVWSVRTPTVGPTTGSFASCGSPLLIGDVLYYTVGGRVLFAVDKATGKEIWKRESISNNPIGRGSAGIVPLRSNGRDFIVFPARTIVDAATGEIAAQFNLGIRGLVDPRRGATIHGDGESIITSIDKVFDRVRLGWKDGKLTTELMWSVKGPYWHCSVVHDRYVYYPTHFNSEPNISLFYWPVDGTGQQQPEKIGGKERVKPTWEIPPALRVADSARKSVAHAPGWQFAAASVAAGHLFVGHDTHGMTVARLAGPDSAIASRNLMDLCIRGNPYFQGNRMYVRSMHYLYCIGAKP